jgi:hypothetical protein
MVCLIYARLHFAEGGRQDHFFSFAFFTADKGKGRGMKERDAPNCAG